MKKRIIALALMLIMILTFSSCDLFNKTPETHTLTLDTRGGSTIEPLSVENGKTAQKPADPTREGYTFGGWYADEACTTEWSFETPITANTTIYAKWIENEPEYEEVHYEFNVSDSTTVGKLTEDAIHSMFIIKSGSEIRNRTKTYEGVEYQKSVKFGSSSDRIMVKVPGPGTLSFLVQNGSSGAETQFIKVTAPDGTVHNIEFAGTSEGSPIVKIDLEVTEGTWLISRGKNGGTQDIFFLSLDCTVPVSPEVGFELVAPGKVDYLAGEDLDISRLVLNATFENGKTEPLAVADVTVDTSAYNKDVAGEYTITVSYKNYAPITYKVTVYTPTSIELGFDAVERLGSSAAGNGVYFNHSFKEVYAIGEELDLAGLSVSVVARSGDAEKQFTVTDYQVTGFDSTEGGDKELTITWGSVSATVTVHVVGTEPSKVGDTYQVKVDKAHTGAIGEVVDGYNMFTTIEQALDFLARVDASEKKLLVISEGLFTEKLEITIPNLTIRGAGKDKTTIEWDSLYGLVDAGGFTHTTDSTQTVAVRDTATNVTIENLTISNYWNSQDRMDKASLAIERGLALLVQADRFIMKDSALLGIQDTLELFTGRQYFENVFISGYTDFIFGTNNTTYFKNCTIHVIDTSKDDGGTAGYLTAFKGSNKGADDAIVYGAIFDGCKFTADEGVMEGKTAIGRTWGAYAAVAVINSEIGGHISLDGYDKAENKNKRYISMNGVHPTDETVQFVEYNNTGAGAITEAVAGMRMLTAEEAAKYADFATIFGTTNGMVSYLDPWDPNSTEIVVDDRTYYYFNGQQGSSGTSYTYDQKLEGTTGTFGDIAIDATKGKVTVRTSDTQLNAGAKLTFEVKAGTLVTVISYPGYGYYTLNGVAHNANDTFSQYYAEDTTVVLEATATAYLYQIIINPDEEAPEAPTLTEIKASGINTNYTVGDELSLEGLTVKAYYSDSSVVTLTSDDYTVDASAVNNAAAGEYAITFSYNGVTATVSVLYIDPNDDTPKAVYYHFDGKTTDGATNHVYDQKIEKATGNLGDMTIDASAGKLAYNAAGYTQFNKDTKLSFDVAAGSTVIVVSYPGQYKYTINGVAAEANETTIKFDEATTVEIIATGGAYLYYIAVIPAE